ncbi:hypothetical protein Tco_0917609 [Tanacetum coccineum]
MASSLISLSLGTTLQVDIPCGYDLSKVGTINSVTRILHVKLVIGMDGVRVRLVKEVTVGVDAFIEEEYVSYFNLYKEFISIDSIDKAWTFKSPNGQGSHTMFGQCHLCQDSDGGLNVESAPFLDEATGASLIMPSPSGSKLLAMDVNGVVEVDGVKDEAETGATNDSAKEGGHQVFSDPSLSLKQRSLVTDDVARSTPFFNPDMATDMHSTNVLGYVGNDSNLSDILSISIISNLDEFE